MTDERISVWFADHRGGTIDAITAYNNGAKRRNLLNQTDFNAKFATGWIEHTLLVGAELGRETTSNLRTEGFFPTATNPSGVQTIFVPITASRISRPDILWREAATSGDNYSIASVVAGSAMAHPYWGWRHHHCHWRYHHCHRW